jgi:AmiR/NasT family two-component response regulator
MIDLLLEREALLREQIDAAAVRLADIAKRIAADGYTVEGSEKQPVPNRMLRVEVEVQRGQQALYRELQAVTSELETERLLERANAISRRSA